ncbi:DPP IV N-terminal domain-containing protein [Ferruginibacter sp. HRS2-29]|uniref:S9 family peptidase n=1 Tax=Ferruginibacter sp. HRS2-29 TaxID=2487334 RepID=UPI0020CFDB7F|nr:DPP IV N-terminal domain-containing protein [Ferruginibacter sp. HRS2-29]MCP9751770.1 S9 family peptidase [Ferruginibacter sp. HRS2-29]
MKKCFLALALICSLQTFAQQKILTMQEAMLNARTSLAPENLRQLQFIKGTDDYIYLKKINGADVFVRGNFSSKEDVTFLTLAQFNSKLRAGSIDTVATFPVIQFNNDNWVVSLKGTKYSFNSGNDQYKVLLDKQLGTKENIDQSADGYNAYLDAFNLFVSKNGVAKKVTSDGSENIVYASAVHQSEFGITKGTFWSNNGKLLAFYRMDQSMIPDYPIIDWSSIPAKNKNIRYPMAGDSSHHVTVGVYNAETDRTTWLKTGLPAEQFLTNIAWSPDDKYVYIAVENRQQNHVWLNQYDASSGDFIKTLFEETDPKYTEPLVPMLFVKNDPAKFIWQSRRDGWNHLYLYDISGKLIKQLTGGQWEVLEVKGFDAKGQQLAYVSTEESPVTKNLYLLDIKTGKKKRVTAATAVHNTLISNSGSYVLDNYSTPTNPRTIELVDTKTGKTKQLLQATDPLAAYAKGALSIFTIKNNEGTDLYCRMFTPVNFDSTKRYPVVVYWYGGPHAQMILNSWNGGAGDYWFQYMAERGYVVFTIDTRGSSSRGKAFEQSIFRHTGEPQMEDMLTAVDFLKSKPYVDAKNMGLFGWSYGGFMTTDFLLHHPGVFKAGVAGGPVMNWRMYEIMYGERYMDTPQENPDGYSATDLTKQAGKLKDKLLLIHGLQDPVVLQQHSVNFVRAAIDAGVQVDYMIYPGHEHNVIGKDRAHLYQKVTDYFEANLK